MHTKKHRGNKRKTQRGCGMCGKKRCKKHRKQTMKGGCGTCMSGGGQKGGNFGSSVGFIDNVATVSSGTSLFVTNILRGFSGLPALATF
jgi:hypothetical protein